MSYSVGRVSILVPLYNRAAYITQTIQSALSQTYSDFEIIVVDDGSTDGGDKLVEAFIGTGKIKLLRHPQNENRGQSVSLNLALGVATGEFVVILDSDDIILPEKLAQQVSFLSSHPDVGLVYGMGLAVDENGSELYKILSASHVERNDPNLILLDCYFHLPVGSLVRKKIYDQLNGFDENLRAGQDHDMMIRMIEVTKFAFDPVLVYHYRRHGDSISAKGLERRWRNALVILNKAIVRYPYKSITVRKRRAVINFRLAQSLFAEKKLFVEAFFRFIYSALLDPARASKVLLGKEKIT